MNSRLGQDETPSWEQTDVSARKEMFRPFRCRVSVVGCNALNYCLLPTDTPAAEVSVVKIHVYRELCPTTDTYSKKG